MSDQLGVNSSLHALRLLGPPRIESPDGVVDGGITQRHRLALLALLSLAPSAVVRRDRLIGLLWPETETDKARHLLNVAVHAIRKALGESTLITGGDALRLELSRLRIDVLEFQQSVQRGDVGAAVDLYAGPFLEGLALPRAVEFEHWQQQETTRLKQLYLSALEESAHRTARERGAVAALPLWQRRLACTPDDARAVLQLMRILGQSGRRAEALRVAADHAQLLTAEFGVAADPDVEAYAASLRQSPAHMRPPSQSSDVAPSLLATARQPANQRLEPSLPASTEFPDPLIGREAVATLASSRTIAVPRRIALPSRRLARLALMPAAGLALLGVGYFALSPDSRLPGRAQPDYPRTAVAVLPFENLSVDPPSISLAGGLHEAVLTQLSAITAISVRARTSVMAYAGTTKSVQQIAEELRVGTLVEASVQVLGDQLRVNVRLVDAATDENLWTGSYDRTLDDAFAIQSGVAQEVVTAVGAALTSADRSTLSAAPTANPEAYRFYLQAREYNSRPGYSRHNFEMAQQLYERALALDPAFALAHANLSEVHGWMHWLGYDPSATRAARQREAAKAALRLAPGLPQAHHAMGQWHYFARRDYAAALAEYEIGLRGLPNDWQLWGAIGAVNRRLGNWEAVYRAFRRVAELDPRNVVQLNDLGAFTYRFTRRYEDAIRVDNRALELAPDFHLAAVHKAWTYVGWQGQLDTLRATLQRVPADADLVWLGGAAGQRAALFLWEREPDSLIGWLRGAHADVFPGLPSVPASLYAGWAHQLRGDTAAARLAFDSTLGLLDSVSRGPEAEWEVHAARGLALAGLGRHEEAVREAQWIEQTVLYRKDVILRAYMDEDRARILGQVGEADAALDVIERLLTGPSQLTVHSLRLDPRWDPLRSDPRFQGLLRRMNFRR